MRGEVHDLANHLTAIFAFAEIGEEEACGERARRYFRNIKAAADRSTQLLGRMRGEAPAPEARCDVLAIAREQTRALRDLGRDVQGPFTCGPVRPARIAPLDAYRVIQNLLRNACDAGTRRIQVRIDDGAQGEEMIRIQVRDWCGGMTAELRDRLLRCECLTTKGPGRGTGLCRIVWPILIRAGGRLEIETTEGEGCTFTAVIPAVQPA